jgi:hypothetical protein
MTAINTPLVIGECRACRQRKEIVKSVGGLQYCADHSHLAPTRRQLDEYYNPSGKLFHSDTGEVVNGYTINERDI